MSESTPPDQNDLTDEEKSNDEFFQRIAKISQEMLDAHGKDFSMGALVLAARWIAEDKIKGSKAK